MTSLNAHITQGDPEQLFRVIEVIGQGSFGLVCTCINTMTNNIVAIKFLETEPDDANQTLKREITILKNTAECPNIVQYHGCYLKDNNLMIVMEYCDGGSVLDIMSMCERKLTERQIAAVLYDVLQGLVYLHSNKILHRDIKAGNVLLNRQGKAKLSDFGVSAILVNTGFKQKTVVIFVIPFRQAPTLEVPGNWSKEFNDFVTICLNKEADKRPTAKELLEHPFIQRGKIDCDKIISELVEESIPVMQEYRRRKAEEEYEDDEEPIGAGVVEKGTLFKLNTATNTATVLADGGTQQSNGGTFIHNPNGDSYSGSNSSGTVVFSSRGGTTTSNCNSIVFNSTSNSSSLYADLDEYDSGSVVFQGTLKEKFEKMKLQYEQDHYNNSGGGDTGSVIFNNTGSNNNNDNDDDDDDDDDQQ
ncbi:hypothetical protein SAMD00019534_067500 [Acytostelium subglobosum LB1]|uniref:hypothetical protein n=1 Tax=Acytostelium subglobosum LB1 TaxID=1410327 RepID=UPI000644E988|nr:hypothetical protein SAMD00019534_067500 [Acytostelium subglobosum LB1]GAM23575.1 hypothetical protein SAMD00019534_067500 [Acytostelium subglobosum LB1]|eukprot:XP_012753316.1 hypothetical protein SAMD00019534_067500 [Acytostelium subglobosum LB1]